MYQMCVPPVSAALWPARPEKKKFDAVACVASRVSLEADKKSQKKSSSCPAIQVAVVSLFQSYTSPLTKREL
jgi:hypothetical protein